MIQIYGSANSSASRVYWALEELGLPYEVMPLDMRNKEHKSEAFLKLNPNGKIPCLVDNGFVIWESMAINQYLCEKYRPELLGRTAEEKGLITQWSVWGLGELQPPLVEIIVQMLFTPEDKRDLKVVEACKERTWPRLAILNNYLKGKKFMVGDRLTIADINVGTVVSICDFFQISLSDYPNIQTWMSNLNTVPSRQKIAKLKN